MEKYETALEPGVKVKFGMAGFAAKTELVQADSSLWCPKVAQVEDKDRPDSGRPAEVLNMRSCSWIRDAGCWGRACDTG